MEVIVMNGGLGNQLFQYAFYLAKKKISPDVSINIYSVQRERTHNGFELERLFGFKSDNTSFMVRLVRKLLIFKQKRYYHYISSLLLKIVVKLTGIKIVQEKDCSLYNSDYLQSCKGLVLYFGFWQTALYFDAFQDEIWNKFSWNMSQLSNKSNTLLDAIQSKESVSIHIRRGDFVTKVDNETCDTNYYKKSISLINSKIEKPYFVFFSDDPEWVKENLPYADAEYVDWNHGVDAWQDMCLMSKCKHNIIANSTFSWWGAWLNTNKEKIVIAPKSFIRNAETPDIYPSDWIILE
jgi:hypothetical protein